MNEKHEHYTGFLTNWLKETYPHFTGADRRAAAAKMAWGLPPYVKREFKPGLPGYGRGIWLEHVPVSTLRALVEIKRSRLPKRPGAIPMTVPPPTTSALVAELRAMVNTINALVEAMEEDQRTISELRNEVARLSVKARKAMVVYGD